MKMYRLEYFIAKKADLEQKTSRQITSELIEFLDIKPQSFRNLCNTKAGDNIKVSGNLLRISQFFQCRMDDLINPAHAKSVIDASKSVAQ